MDMWILPRKEQKHERGQKGDLWNRVERGGRLDNWTKGDFAFVREKARRRRGALLYRRSGLVTAIKVGSDVGGKSM